VSELTEERIETIRRLTVENWSSAASNEQRRCAFSNVNLRLEVMYSRSIRYQGFFPMPEKVRALTKEEFPQFVGANDQRP